jgi:surface antigen
MGVINMVYTQRLTAPSTTDKNWLHYTKGGYNYCILISGNSCLPNCVGYAWGRWRELLGSFHKLSRSNAENWWGNTGDGYARGSSPKVGAVICWRKGKAGNGDDGAGHVAIVEKVYADGTVKTSNSGYGGTRFWIQTIKPPYNIGTNYHFQGFIYNPNNYDGKQPHTDPTNLKYKNGDVVRFTGTLFGNSYGGNPGQTRNNLKATITSTNAYGTKPYNINNGLGWVAEADLVAWVEPTPTPTPEPTPQPVEQFPIGTKVRIVGTGNGSSYGRSNTAYGIGWTRYVTNIWYGRPYPYQIGNYGKTNSANTTGFYKAESIQKI